MRGETGSKRFLLWTDNICDLGLIQRGKKTHVARQTFLDQITDQIKLTID